MTTDHIDESLYSRQLYVMGFDAQRKMASSDVLLVGLNGLGIEVAKNIVLSGVRSVTLLDNTAVTSVDLASQFYCQFEDIGRPRAAVSAPKLSELNPYVPVNVVSEELTLELVSSFRVVVLIGVSEHLVREIADYCHNNSICVIAADMYGVFCNVFCDFGDNFVVSDIDGEPAATCLIASITRDNPGLVCALEETRHHLRNGDIVEISGLAGMNELNDCQFAVTVKDPNSFEINVDTTNMSAHEVGGYVRQVKQPTAVSFSTYSKSLVNPGEFVSDFSKLYRAGALHIGFRSVLYYRVS